MFCHSAREVLNVGVEGGVELVFEAFSFRFKELKMMFFVLFLILINKLLVLFFPQLMVFFRFCFWLFFLEVFLFDVLIKLFGEIEFFALAIFL